MYENKKNYFNLKICEVSILAKIYTAIYLLSHIIYLLLYIPILN